MRKSIFILLILLLQSSAYSTNYITSTFTCDDSTTAICTPETGQSWVYGGTGCSSYNYGVSSNRGYCSNASGYCYPWAVLNAGVSDCEMTCDFPVVSATQSGLAFRFYPSNNIGYYLRYDGTNYNVGLWYSVSFYSLGAGGTPANGDQIKIDMTDTSIIVKLNGGTIITATDTYKYIFGTYKTYFGLFSAYYTGSPAQRWDNLYVDDIPVANTSTPTGTYTPIPTSTPTLTPTETLTLTLTSSKTATNTPTITHTQTATRTATQTATATFTPPGCSNSVYDSFTGTATMPFTADTGNWYSVISGSMSKSGGGLHLTSGYNSGEVRVDGYVNNAIVRLTLKDVGGASAQTWIQCQLPDLDDDHRLIADNANSRYICQGKGADFYYNVAPQNNDVMEIEYSASTLIYRINGTTILSRGDTDLEPGTIVGIYISDTSQSVVVDDFYIDSIVSCTSTTTSTDTRTATKTPTATETATYTTTNTSTETNTPTLTLTSSKTFTSTATPTQTETATETMTSTVTGSVTHTNTETYTSTETPTQTQTATQTYTFTRTATFTLTYTRTRTATATVSPTFTVSPTYTPVACVYDRYGVCHVPTYTEYCNKTDRFIWVVKQNAKRLVITKITGNFINGSGDIWFEDITGKVLSRKFRATEKVVYVDFLPSFIGETNVGCDIVLRATKPFLGCFQLFWFAY